MSARGTFHNNRLSVRMARSLAKQGHGVLRFDTERAGESPGRRAPDLYEPRVQEILGATRWLQAQGLKECALVGSCFGAHSALAASSELENISKIVLAVLPFANSTSSPHRPKEEGRLRRRLRGLSQAMSDPASRHAAFAVVKNALSRRIGRWTSTPLPREKRRNAVSPETSRWLERLTARGVPTLLLFGEEDRAYQSFQEEMAKWPEIANAEREGLLEITVASQHRVHAVTTIAAQEWFIDTVVDWFAKDTAAS